MRTSLEIALFSIVVMIATVGMYSMANPTITYGQGWHDDCNSTTNWNKTESGLGCTMTVTGDDVFQIACVCDDAAAESAYYEKDLSSLSLTTDLYPKITARWKTSASAVGAATQVQVHYVGGDYDVLQPTWAGSMNTSWTTLTSSLSPGYTISSIRIALSDWPHNTSSGTYYVYYDFLMIHKGTFTFPQVQDGIELNIDNTYADLFAPTRESELSQTMGMASPTVKLDGKVNISTTGWGTPLLRDLYRIMQDSHDNTFQWFTSDIFNGKVTPRNLNIRQTSDAQRTWHLELKQYSRSSGGLSVWDDLGWWNLVTA